MKTLKPQPETLYLGRSDDYAGVKTLNPNPLNLGKSDDYVGVKYGKRMAILSIEELGTTTYLDFAWLEKKV